MIEKKERVEILDGLRVIAIFMVMFFHFYCTKVISYSYKIPTVISYGNLGVQLFFIISGFVITLTLTKCNSLFEFIKKRFIRLIPGMLVCSIITFLIFSFFDPENIFVRSKSFSNLIFSNTFLNPSIINKLFNTHFKYIDPVYWTLFIELQFYFLAALIYFYSPVKFYKNILIVSTVLFLINLITFHRIVFSGKLLWLSIVLLGFFELPKFILWFLIGIVINYIYFKNNSKKNFFFLLLLFFIEMLESFDIYISVFILFCIVIFYCFLYLPKALNFLTKPLFKKVGIASYSIYLIHENIGVLIIKKFSNLFGNFNWIIPIILIFLFSLFGIFSYKYLENPIGVKLKRLFF